MDYNENVLKTFSDNPNWKLALRQSISMIKSKTISNAVVVTTIQTMFRGGEDSYFLKEISKLDDFIIIADECHNLSTELVMNNIPLKPTRRIGLSATPVGDITTELETRMLDYFGGIVAEYNLSDAIRENRLCKYNYYPIIVELDHEEKEKYGELSKSIATLAARLKANPTEYETKKKLELTNYKRARIVYGARDKIKQLEFYIESGIIEKDYLLVYCGATSYLTEGDDNDSETVSQLNEVNHLLKEMNITCAQYTSSEDYKNRKNAIEFFEKGTISTLVAIKCLDEGVDIPLIKNAVILASSNSKREFVQRRGRVLRKAQGKDSVNIFDMVVRDYENKNSLLNINETKRMIEFASDAENSEEIYRANYDYIELVNKGEEEISHG